MEKENIAMELAITLLLLALQVNAQIRGGTRLAGPAPRITPQIQQPAARVYPAQTMIYSGAQTPAQSTWYQKQSSSVNPAMKASSPNGYAVATPQVQAQSFNAPIQTNVPNGYAVATPQVQAQSFNAPIQTNVPNGYAVATPQVQAQSVNAPIQTNVPNGYAVATPQVQAQVQMASVNAPIQTAAPNGYAVAAPQVQVQSFNAPIQTAAPNGYAVAAPVPVVDPTAVCDAKWKAALKREIMNVDDWQCATRTGANGSPEPCIITGPTANSVFKNSSACGWKLPPFCDNTVNDLMNSLRPAPPTFPVPAGYTLVPGLGYFKVHTETMSWDAAQQVCISEGVNVNLAVPSTVSDYQAILDLVNQALPTQTKGVFVGITDQAVEGTFVTVTGQPLCTLGQVLFLPGEPNNAGGNENCLEIGYLKGLFMNDIPCQGPLPFVCEQPLPALLGPC